MKKRTELDRYFGGDQLDQQTHYRLLEDWEQKSGKVYIWKNKGQNMNVHIQEAMSSKQDTLRDLTQRSMWKYIVIKLLKTKDKES